MARYYDVVLGMIPLSLIGVTAVLSALGFSITSAVPIGATVSVVLIGHALFVNGPVDPTQSGTDSVEPSARNSFETAD